MSDKNRHDDDGDARTLSGSYALDAVDREERERYERALDGSEELRQEAAGFADTAALLGASVPPVAPPPALKAGILAALDGLPQLPAQAGSETREVPEVQDAQAALAQKPVGAAGSAVPESPAGSTFQPAASTTGPAEAAARRRWFARPGALIGVAAASVALIAAVVIGAGWSGPNGWGAQRELASIQQASDVQQAEADVTGGGRVTLVWSGEQGQSAIMVEDLAELDAAKTYELWYIGGDGATSAGTFTVGSDGATWRVLDGTMSAGDAVGVTVEPAGGSKQPTTEPIVVVPTEA